MGGQRGLGLIRFDKDWPDSEYEAAGMGAKTFSDTYGRWVIIGHALDGELSSISPRTTWKVGLEGMLYASTSGIRRVQCRGSEC